MYNQQLTAIQTKLDALQTTLISSIASSGGSTLAYKRSGSINITRTSGQSATTIISCSSKGELLKIMMNTHSSYNEAYTPNLGTFSMNGVSIAENFFKVFSTDDVYHKMILYNIPMGPNASVTLVKYPITEMSKQEDGSYVLFEYV